MRIVELEDGREKDSRGGEIAKVKAKRALVGAGARILFYPTLIYNVIRNKVQAEFHWWDEIDQFLLLGAVPFPNDVPRLQQLGVRGVITLNEPYETLVPSSLYMVHGIDHLVIPTRDYLFAPSLVDIYRAVDFIHRNASCGRTTYVHCKAGRGRSTTIVLCYLVQHKNMTPTAALEYVQSIRPRVLLAPSQWKAVQQYSQCKLEFPAIRSPRSTDLLTGDEVLISEVDLEGYNVGEDTKDLSISSCKMAEASPTIVKHMTESPIGGDEVLITEADLEGYETFMIACEDGSLSSTVTTAIVPARTRMVMRRLCCLCTSLKSSGGSQAVASRFHEIHAC
ncbi:phosphatidylglycerophosphate phosphatase PTPMT2-like [Musa acuminata AAA Group]|uniref:phosphatidylglycerophosphate phosphatase PTPMT2-like n=1 Tax=Musa acuminata AAA Group TaxID=214697 RepID=UPI0031D883A3